MSIICAKKGCEKEGVKTLEFRDPIYNHLQHSAPVCEGHLKEAQGFSETDAVRVSEWLNT
jgi:hypothetical protein